jgi:flagellar protein FlaF
VRDVGFSTSASLLVIFIATFIALGSVYTAGSNATDRVSEAQIDQLDRHHELRQTSINVTGAEWELGTLRLRINNTGTSVLSVNATDVLVNGEYIQVESFLATVDGEITDRWGLDEQLVLTTDSLTQIPDRVKIVTEVGVADTRSVEVI